MNIALNPNLQKLVKKKISSGLYHSASEVIQEALQLLENQDRLIYQRLKRLRKDIAIGIDQADRGALLDGKKSFEKLRLRNKSRRSAKK